jgi:hypothetical protein
MHWLIFNREGVLVVVSFADLKPRTRDGFRVEECRCTDPGSHV